MGLFAKGVCRDESYVAQSGLIAGFDIAGDAKNRTLDNPSTDFEDGIPSSSLHPRLRQTPSSHIPVGRLLDIGLLISEESPQRAVSRTVQRTGSVSDVWRSLQ